MDGSKRQRMEISDAASGELFIAVQEIHIRVGDDNVVTSAPAM